ncbi:AAA family ATPase [Cupriavidus sp. AcVe19-6a]|uniref:AAA family ATPase n=1 Tax=Cupriavidus sp. AcVe19-6a TaxID=2821358 RepID=UPI001AE83664|nr:AAA family ATPase [Cupriavidus sp. AcVe19-6a]MBP0635522.1 AAA family ATPase [Cupriavidus sp. AcVe19-6a]
MQAEPSRDDDEDMACEAAMASIRANGHHFNGHRNGQPFQSNLELRGAEGITMESIEWLWKDHLAHGKLSILAGDAGTGKTTLALSIAAYLSCGRQWPDGAPMTEPGTIVMWSGEDDIADTLLPRYVAMYGDRSRMCFVGAARDADGHHRPFDPASDLPLLAEAISQIPGRVSLLIIDPVVSAVAGDMHKSNDVRRALQPLVDLASSTGVAVIGVTHFTKNSRGSSPLHRVNGSQAFGAVARVVLVAGKEEDTGRRILARAKSNIGTDTGGMAYSIEQTEAAPGIPASFIRWGEQLEGSARELLGVIETDDDPEERGALTEAKTFLADLLADGPMAQREVMKNARGAGHSQRTIERAKAHLGVQAKRLDGVWKWGLP